jgi:hypothetical protein
MPFATVHRDRVHLYLPPAAAMEMLPQIGDAAVVEIRWGSARHLGMPDCMTLTFENGTPSSFRLVMPPRQWGCMPCCTDACRARELVIHTRTGVHRTVACRFHYPR